MSGLALLGCSPEDSRDPTDSAGATSAVPVTTLTPPASTATSSPADEDSPSATGPGPALGSVVRQNGYGAINLPGVKLTTSRGSATLDRVGVAGYFVQVCATGATAIEVSPSQFSLTSLDGGQVMPAITNGGYTPALEAGTVTSGSCIEGYVTYDLATTQSDAYLLSWFSTPGKAVWSFNG